MPTYKINYSGGKARVVNVNKLPNKTTLQSLDRVYFGQPFVNVVSKFQDTRGLDTVYLGQPFYGHTNGIAISSSRISTANNPDVDNWLNTISFNGGSASSTTIAALNNFCNSIDSAGLRNKFYRLNLFCGNNLQTCLVPLYNAMSSNNIQFGYDKDTNYNFINANYSEMSGLQSSSATGFLDTGVISATLAANNLHFGVGLLATDTSSTLVSRTLMGLQDGLNNDALVLNVSSSSNCGLAMFGQWNDCSYTFGDSGSSQNPVRLATGNIIASWPNMYRNGSVTGTTATNYKTHTSIHAKTIYVFGNNLQGAGSRLTDARLGWYSIGSAMTSTQIGQFNTIINTFYSSIGRT